MPAQSIRNQFRRAADEIMKNQVSAAIWYPMLAQYGPALLEEADKAVELSKKLVTSWLAAYMFRRHPNKHQIAGRIADYLADYDQHKTHARPLGYDDLKAQGMRVSLIEQKQELQDRVLTVYHAAMHAFANTAATKIIQNHQGKAYVRLAPASQNR